MCPVYIMCPVYMYIMLLLHLTIVLCFVVRFNLVGYGCMTCIGNSGPLPEAVMEAIDKVRIYYV